MLSLGKYIAMVVYAFVPKLPRDTTHPPYTTDKLAVAVIAFVVKKRPDSPFLTSLL